MGNKELKQMRKDAAAESSPFYTTAEVLAYLKVSMSVLYRLMDKGILKRPQKFCRKNTWSKSYIHDFAQRILQGKIS
ncbi:MAG: helix-turn-helix domain-containing protein [Desulfovibrionaceae bacterium]|nr:helix-turn-helix domain-containing protein [Desulfovibrionaceae bacterium]